MKKKRKTVQDYIRTLFKVINSSDLLLEVLDARMPKDTRIPKLERMITNKKKELILVINKADLVPEDFVEKVKSQFEYEYPTVYISTKTRKGSRALRKAIKDYAPFKDKVYIGVFGYPNTGKSSLINILVGRHRVGVSPTPGFTKGMQLIKLSRKFYLIDTPGVYFPQSEVDLAIKGGVDPSKVRYPMKAVRYLYDRLPREVFEETYKISFNDFEDFLEKLAKKRGFLLSGKPDKERAARQVLRDWINGKIKGYWL